MAPKIEFFELWRALISDLDFSSFFFDFVAPGLGTFVQDFEHMLKILNKSSQAQANEIEKKT